MPPGRRCCGEDKRDRVHRSPSLPMSGTPFTRERGRCEPKNDGSVQRGKKETTYGAKNHVAGAPPTVRATFPIRTRCQVLFFHGGESRLVEVDGGTVSGSLYSRWGRYSSCTRRRGFGLCRRFWKRRNFGRVFLGSLVMHLPETMCFISCTRRRAQLVMTDWLIRPARVIVCLI